MGLEPLRKCRLHKENFFHRFPKYFLNSRMVRETGGNE